MINSLFLIFFLKNINIFKLMIPISRKMISYKKLQTLWINYLKKSLIFQEKSKLYFFNKFY